MELNTDYATYTISLDNAIYQTDALPSKEDYLESNKRTYTDFSEWSEPKYKCPKCENGGMRKNLTVILTSLPCQYVYKCNECGYTEHHFV